MRKSHVRFVAAFILMGCMSATKVSAQQHRLWYAQPAHHWLEALPIGNSQMGAMVYGATDVEEIQLNEESFWSGSPHHNNSATARQHLQEVRDLVLLGREEEAHQVIEKNFLHGPHGMRFLPLGSLKMKLGHTDVSDYRRELNLGDAVATTRYVYQGVTFERTVFASLADHAIVMRLTASKKGTLAFGMSFDSQLPFEAVTQRVGNEQSAISQLSATVKNVEQEGIRGGLTANCVVEVETDGDVSRGDKELSIAHATSAILYIAAATNYVNYHDISGNPVGKVNRVLESLRGKPYQQLLKRHQEKYHEQKFPLANRQASGSLCQGIISHRSSGSGHGVADDAVRALPAHLLISAWRAGCQPARCVERQDEGSVGFEIYHQYQYGDELLAGTGG